MKTRAELLQNVAELLALADHQLRIVQGMGQQSVFVDVASALVGLGAVHLGLEREANAAAAAARPASPARPTN